MALSYGEKFVCIKGISSNHVGDFYCLNCFHSYSTKNKLKKYERVCNDHNCCVMKTTKY